MRHIANWLLLSCCYSVVAQSPTNPTSCAVSDLTTLNSIDYCPTLTCSHASVLAHIPLGAAVPPFSFVSGLAMTGTGREFALICASNGLMIVDTHDLARTAPGSVLPPYWSAFLAEDPAAIAANMCAGATEHRGVVAMGNLFVESNLHRAYLRVYELSVSSTGYSVSRLANIDLNPAPWAPFLGAVYRMTVDPDTGVLFVPGCPPSVGTSAFVKLKAYNLRNFPAVPPAPNPIMVWEGGGAGVPPTPAQQMNSFDVHLFRQGSARRAVVSEFAGNSIAVLDISDLTPPFPANYSPLHWVQFTSPDPIPHSSWVDPSRQLLYTSINDAITSVLHFRSASGVFNFNANAVMTLPADQPLAVNQPYHQATTPLRYQTLGKWHHTLEGVGMTGMAASWDAGLRVIDLRPDALDPEMELAQVITCAPCSLPTAPCIGSFHHGVWGIYRSQDSGVVYLSDQALGLFLIRVEAAHLNRYGIGTAGPSHASVPTVSLDHGPPRVTRAATAATPQFKAIPALDVTLPVTVSNLLAGGGNRWVGLDICLMGDESSQVYFDPAQSFKKYGVLTVPVTVIDPIPLGASSVVLQVPLASAWEGLPLFMQAVVYEVVGGSPQVVATSRGTWVGVAAQRP